MLALVVSVLADIFQVYCYYLVFHCLFEKCKLSKKGELIFYAFFFLQTTIPHLVVNVAAISQTYINSSNIFLFSLFFLSIKYSIKVKENITLIITENIVLFSSTPSNLVNKINMFDKIFFIIPSIILPSFKFVSCNLDITILGIVIFPIFIASKSK